MNKYKIIPITSEHLDVKDEFVLVDTTIKIEVTKPYQIVAERLITGCYDLFTIDNINEINKKCQYVVVATTWKIGDIPVLYNTKEQILKMYELEKVPNEKLYTQQDISKVVEYMLKNNVTNELKENMLSNPRMLEYVFLEYAHKIIGFLPKKSEAKFCEIEFEYYKNSKVYDQPDTLLDVPQIIITKIYE